MILAERRHSNSSRMVGIVGTGVAIAAVGFLLVNMKTEIITLEKPKDMIMILPETPPEPPKVEKVAPKEDTKPIETPVVQMEVPEIIIDTPPVENAPPVALVEAPVVAPPQISAPHISAPVPPTPISSPAGSSPNDVRDPAAMLNLGRPLLEGRSTAAGLPLRVPGGAKPNVGGDERSVGVSQPDQVRANLAAFARGVTAAAAGTSLADRVAAERAALAARPVLPRPPTNGAPETPADTRAASAPHGATSPAERTN